MPSTRSLRASKPNAASGVFRVVVINLGILFVLVVVAELVFGHWLSGPQYGAMNLARNVDRYFDTANLYEGGNRIHYSLDENGLRGTYSDPSKIHILTIGGSTTKQLYIDDRETWQTRLQDLFAVAGQPATVVNAAVDGQSTRGHIAVFDLWFPQIPNLRAQHVLAYVGINDVTVSGSSIDRLDYSSIWKRLKFDSALVRLWRTVVGMWQAERARLNHSAIDFRAASWTDRPGHAAAKIPDVGPYKERLKAMAGLIRAMGAEPVFITQSRGDAMMIDGRLQGLAGADGLNGLDEHGVLAGFNAATMQVCGELKISCADLAHEIGFEIGDFYDRIHNTPDGAEKIGRWLAGKVGPLLK